MGDDLFIFLDFQGAGRIDEDAALADKDSGLLKKSDLVIVQARIMERGEVLFEEG